MSGKVLKKKVGIDMDDILMEFAANLFKFYNDRTGTNFCFDDAHRYELDQVWNCPMKEAIKVVFDFYDSETHHESLPVSGAVAFIKNIKPKAEIFVITARPEKYKEVTLKWIEKHFPGMFDGVIFTGQYNGDEKPLKKSEICKQLGIEVFIDDAIHNVSDVANVGIKTFLFNKPWNREITPINATRVFTWEEIVI